MTTFNDRLKSTRQKLDNISPSFCAAKWTQVTLHLGNGTNHSCHHPAVHSFDPEEVAKNPNALHNTKYKKEQRKQMLEGQRPHECDYCWRVEDANKKLVDTPREVFSDRITKSSDGWSAPYIDDIVTAKWDADYYPRYVEVDFENTCNLKCAYCSPSYSSQWQKEIRDYGPYVMETDPNLTFNSMEDIMAHSKVPMKPEVNPYIDAFWSWFPEAVNHMQHFRVTGGEPLMSKNLMKVLDYLIENPQPNLHFNINSNLNPSQDLFDKFMAKLDILLNKNCIRDIKIYTSAEAHGDHCDYIRYGMDYNQWLKNIEILLERYPEKLTITVMSTVNALSTQSYKEFLQDIVTIRENFRTVERPRSITIDFPYLRHPEFLAVWVLESPQLMEFEKTINWVHSNINVGGAGGFYAHEAEGLRRVWETALGVNKKRTEEGNIQGLRRAFYSFITEYDKRRKLNFTEIFPTLEEFYYLCEEEYNAAMKNKIPVININE
jgi:organic radical activating enzyme